MCINVCVYVKVCVKMVLWTPCVLSDIYMFEFVYTCIPLLAA